MNNLQQNKPKKKIIFFLTSLVSGGEERTASVLAKELSTKEELIFVFFNKPIDFEIPKNVRVKILRPVYKWRLWRLLTLPLVVWRYYQFCQTEKITHSIAFDSLPNFCNCLIKKMGWKGQAILRESNHVTTRFPAATIRGKIFHWFIRNLYPAADLILVNAWRIGTDLQQQYGIQIPIQLSLNPIDLSSIQRLSQKIVIPKKQFTFIHVGMFRAQKNHLLLLQAFAEIKHLAVDLWLVGKGDLEAIIRAEILRLGLSEKVHLKGFSPNPYQFMAAVDCMLLSSDYEGLPNVLSEGLACGLPIISTDCPSGPREIIAPDTDKKQKATTEIELAKYGILTPVGNAEKLAEAMTYVYKNSKYRKGDFYKERVKPFSVETVVEKLLEELK